MWQQSLSTLEVVAINFNLKFCEIIKKYHEEKTENIQDIFLSSLSNAIGRIF